jgi:hypothetical protein
VVVVLFCGCNVVVEVGELVVVLVEVEIAPQIIDTLQLSPIVSAAISTLSS